MTTETKKNNKQSISDHRISTHPSYTEYSWDALVGPERRSASVSGTSVGAIGNTRFNRSTGAPKSTNEKGKQKGVRSQHTTAPTAKLHSNDAVKAGESTTAAVAPRLRTKSRVRIHTITVEKKYAFPISVVLLSLCFTILIVAIVTTAVQINEITQINSSLESKYNSLVSDENELRLLLETRDDLRVVEQMAQEELGMVKIDQVERYYLTVHQEDKIEIIEETKKDNTGLFDGISDVGNSIVDRILGFFGR